MAINDPNSDDAETMGRGLSVVLMIIGGLIAGHFGLKLQAGMALGFTNALGIGYIGAFVLIGLGMMALGLKRFHEASEDSMDERDQG